MQEVDFFRTPFFLFKSDKNFAEKISDEIGDILKSKKRIDYISYNKVKVEPKNKIPVTPLNGLDFNVQTSVGGFFDNNGKDTKLENIPSKIRKHIIENIEQIPIRLEFKDVWTNITSNNDYNRVHHHKTECDLVFVLYLTKGTLWVQNPINRVKLDMVYRHVGSSISLDFNVGDMIVFPSDINHWVEPYDGNYDRITIAGNLSIN
tara:strand:+ start:88 stop:702 length:615 start_codon:yes stop_codon:yes gene_type:complete